MEPIDQNTVPRFRGRLAQIAPPVLAEDQHLIGKYLYEISMWKGDASEMISVIGTYGPYDTEAEAKREGSKIIVRVVDIARKEIEKIWGGTSVPGHAIDMNDGGKLKRLEEFLKE